MARPTPRANLQACACFGSALETNLCFLLAVLKCLTGNRKLKNRSSLPSLGHLLSIGVELYFHWSGAILGNFGTHRDQKSFPALYHVQGRAQGLIQSMDSQSALLSFSCAYLFFTLRASSFIAPTYHTHASNFRLEDISLKSRLSTQAQLPSLIYILILWN